MQEKQKEYILGLFQEIKNIEKELREKPMPELKEEDFFLFHRTGNRLVYENAYFGRRKYLTVYAILALWDKELSMQGIFEKQMEAGNNTSKTDVYINYLENILFNICNEKFWALPAHINFDKIEETDTQLTIDLFAAETAQALSEIVLRLYDRLSCEVINRVQGEVCRRVLVPFVNSVMPYSWWETDRCNWAAVCAGSIGMTAINIARLSKKERKIDLASSKQKLNANWEESLIKRVCDSMQCYLDGMEEDGACTEGLGYYNYGMSFYTAFAEACEQVMNNEELKCENIYTAIIKYWKEGFLSNKKYSKKREQIALFQQKCYFAGGISISFSDGSQKEPFLPGLTAYLKHCYPQVQTPDYSLARSFDSDKCYRYLTNERNISWLMRYGAVDTPCKTDVAKECLDTSNLTTYLLQQAQWLVCKDKNGNGFAAKGGNNDENHNHNDIGHFLCAYNGEMLLTDLGAGEYTKDYFSDKRYEILCNRSFGHSVPIINGMEQCTGKEYHANRFLWGEKENTLTIAFESAYKEGSISKITRKIRMFDTINSDEKIKMQLEVVDDFEPNENTTSIEENLITTYMPVIENNKIVIQGEQGICNIVVENNSSPIKQNACVHSDHTGKEQMVYRIQWQLPIEKFSVEKFSVENCIKTKCRMWITFSNT